MADKIYFTITGTGFFEGDEFFEKDMEVLLEKEPDNKYDHEAILVKCRELEKLGMWQIVVVQSLASHIAPDEFMTKLATQQLEKCFTKCQEEFCVN